MSAKDPAEYVSTITAAKELDVSVRVIQKWIKEGKIPAQRFGRLYFIARKKWEEWKARNLVAA